MARNFAHYPSSDTPSVGRPAALAGQDRLDHRFESREGVSGNIFGRDVYETFDRSIFEMANSFEELKKLNRQSVAEDAAEATEKLQIFKAQIESLEEELGIYIQDKHNILLSQSASEIQRRNEEMTEHEKNILIEEFKNKAERDFLNNNHLSTRHDLVENPHYETYQVQRWIEDEMEKKLLDIDKAVNAYSNRLYSDRAKELAFEKRRLFNFLNPHREECFRVSELLREEPNMVHPQHLESDAVGKRYDGSIPRSAAQRLLNAAKHENQSLLPRNSAGLSSLGAVGISANAERTAQPVAAAAKQRRVLPVVPRRSSETGGADASNSESGRVVRRRLPTLPLRPSQSSADFPAAAAAAVSEVSSQHTAAKPRTVITPSYLHPSWSNPFGAANNFGSKGK